MGTSILDILGASTPVSEVLARKWGYVKAAVACRVFFHQQMKDGVCRASVGTLADNLGMSPGAVSGNLKWLRDNEIIEVVGTYKKGNSPNDYRVTDRFFAALNEQPLSADESQPPQNGPQHSAGESQLSFNESETGKTPFPLSADESEVQESTRQHSAGESNFQQMNGKDNINGVLKDSKTKDSDSGDSEFGRIVTLYAENIDPDFSPADADLLADTYDTLTPPGGETRYDWFEFAIRGACRNNVLTRSYVEAILGNIQDSGSLARHREAKSESPAKQANGFRPPDARRENRRETPDGETWQAILNTLQTQMPRAMFGNYAGSYPVGRRGSVLTVATPKELALPWLQHNLQAPTDRVAGAIEPGLTIRFILAERQPVVA